MKKIVLQKKPRKCPSCGGKVGTLFYGFPIMNDKLEKDIEDGKIILGGCCIFADSAMPTWECVNCHQQYWKQSK